MKANIKIQFLSYWHCGSGISGGAESDSLVKKDENGLPFVPGKTLKGHLREAAKWLLGQEDSSITNNKLNEIFGQENPSEKEGEQTGFGYSGKAYFSNSHVHPEIARLVISEKNAKMLYTNLYSTAIDEYGVANKGSLRSLEVAMPLTLYGRIDSLSDDDKDFLKKCMGMVKELGSGKTRGLGRCQISFID